jgi:Ca-activated chloride channel family protein
MRFKLVFISVLLSFLSFSQDEVRKNTYKGNVFYHNSEFKDALYYYEKAVNESAFNFNANFNLGNTFFRLEEFDKAIEIYQKIADYTTDNQKKSKIYHNIGNAQLYNQKIDDAIESYKTALRSNSQDEETRYNLAYALDLKKQKEQQEKDSKDQEKSDDKEDGEEGDKNGKKQEGDKNDSDKNKEDKKDGDQEEDSKDDQESEDSKDDSDSEPNNEKTEEQKISRDQAKRILEEAAKKDKTIQAELNKNKKIETKGEKGDKQTKKDW